MQCFNYLCNCNISISLYDIITYIIIPSYTYERRTKPITSAKWHGWNGHRFLCVPHRSWGFGVVDMKWASDWKEAVAKAEAAEQAATEEKAAAAMKKE